MRRQFTHSIESSKRPPPPFQETRMHRRTLIAAIAPKLVKERGITAD